MSLCNRCVWIVCVAHFLMLGTANCTTAKYHTYEEDAPGTEIGNLSRDLKIDTGEDLQTSFRFMQKANFSLIRLGQTDGLLTVGERIDREQLCPHSPQCLITFDIVAFSKEKFQLIHVEIEVKDINDNSPTFPLNETNLEISENVAVGTRFLLDNAVDQDVDSNYIQCYQISFNSHFGIETREGDDGVKHAVLVLLKQLDRESDDFYTIEVTAVDGGRPPRTGSVTINIKVLDFNDNSPTFEHGSLKVELNEDAPLGFLVVKVRAFDPDDGINGEVVYGFLEDLSNEVKSVFKIDPFSGFVTLNSAVDYETRRSYELIIQSYDLGINSVPSACKVVVEIVDVNDNAPEINIKPMTSMSDRVAYITEAAAEESFVALISTSDSDSGPNGYVRTSLHGHNHFKLQQAYGDTFMIVTTTVLDRERIPEYNLTVVAEDQGSPPFKTIKQYTIRVSDENDNPPLFSKSVYELSVIENNAPGSYIATVIARDSDIGDNGKVTYKLMDGHLIEGAPLSSFVSIDPLSGSLYTARSFDCEMIKHIELKIQASDSGSPQLSSTAIIEINVVDQNDNFPYITYPVLQNDSADIPILSNAPSGYLAIRVQAQDADEGVNSLLSFRIVEDEQMLFSVNKDSGEIVLKYSISFVPGDVLPLKIAVSDNGRSPRSSTAMLRFLVTEMQPAKDQIMPVLESRDETQSEFDVSLFVIITLGGGCGLLVVAIVTVALSCKRNRRGKAYDEDKGKVEGLFAKNLLPHLSAKDTSLYREPALVVSNQGASPQTAASVPHYEERSRDSENEVFPSLSTKHFEPVSLWQGDKYSLQLSGVHNSDQLSVKDSGKGDSDFNDSDSDVSGDGCKKNYSSFYPQPIGSLCSSSPLSVDQRNRYPIIPACSAVPCGSRYSIAYSQALAYSRSHASPASWRGSGYSTSVPKVRLQPQASARTGTLPLAMGHPRQEAESRLGQQHVGIQGPSLATLSEVATSF